MVEFLKSQTCYILSGVPSCGKTTWLKKNEINENLILSLDKIRKDIFGINYSYDLENENVVEELNQNFGNEIGEILKKQLILKLKTNQTIFLDGTYKNDKIRKFTIDILKEYSYDYQILLFNSKNCLKWNEKRINKLPLKVIENFEKEFEYKSKFNHIFIDLKKKYKLIPKFIIDKKIELCVIGDIHGMLNEMKTLIKKEGFEIINKTIIHKNKNKKILFVGDLIDRGNYSLEVLEIVKNSIKKENHFCIIGNHELKLIKNYNKKQDINLEKNSIAVNETFYKFLKLDIEKQKEIISFLKKLPSYYVYKNYVIVHGNITNFDFNIPKYDNCNYGSKNDKSDVIYSKLYDLKINKFKLIRGHIPSNL